MRDGVEFSPINQQAELVRKTLIVQETQTRGIPHGRRIDDINS